MWVRTSPKGRVRGIQFGTSLRQNLPAGVEKNEMPPCLGGAT
jgi:hypothetical protein